MMTTSTKNKKVATWLWSIFVGASILTTPVCAIQARPLPFEVTQPSTNKTISIHIHGGERYRWMSVGNGTNAFTVVRDANGNFVFATRQQDGSLGPSTHVVGQVDPTQVGLETNILASDEARRAACAQRQLFCNEPEEFGSVPRHRRTRFLQEKVEGTVKNLVVLMRWSDHGGRTVPSEEDIEILMNHEGPHRLAPTGSVRDVYWKNSYETLNLTSTVYKWVTMDNTEKFYADGSSGNSVKIQEAIKYALDQLEADDSFDFREFDQDGDGLIDAIAFLHSGYGAEWGGYDAYRTFYEDRIWSHKWALFGGWRSQSDGVRVSDYHISPAVWGVRGSEIGRIGVIAHETGHFFGLPDLYDGSAYGQGIGSWCLMANSWGFDQSQYYPPHFSALMRMHLGWDTATVLSDSGTYEVSASESIDVDTPRIYKIDKGYPSREYLLVENRQPLLFDKKIPQGGLAVWHIDDAQTRNQNAQGFPGMEKVLPRLSNNPWPENGLHYRYALLQSDGRYDLEKGASTGGLDLYHAGGVNEINPSVDPTTGPFPNTDAYKDGNVFQTGNRLYNVSASDLKMTFTYEYNATNTSGGTIRMTHLAVLLFLLVSIWM